MPEALLFTLGAGVRCTDGDCGKISSLVVSVNDAITHLIVEPAHHMRLGKLVPFRLVDSAPSGAAGGEVRLRCTTEEFAELDAAEDTQLLPGADLGLLGAPGLPDEPWQGPQLVVVDTVPDQLPGEDEVSAGERVHATDGDIGHIDGIAAEPGTGRVTSVLLKERHLLRHRTVLIPRSAIAEVGPDGFRLILTIQQVRDLPEV